MKRKNAVKRNDEWNELKERKQQSQQGNKSMPGCHL